MPAPKQLYVSTPKTIIPDLPRFTFEGRIEVIQSESEAIRAVRALKGAPLLGIDTETRPSFRKGEKHKVALLQVSDRDICFLFRLNMLGFAPCLVELLSDPTITKVGLSLRDDFMMLRGRRSFTPGGCIDLQEKAKLFGIEDMSLQKLFANIFGQRISKTAQLSNWEADTLTQSQKVYAATDAYACILLYEELLRLRQSGNYTLIQPENEPK
ncbi:MAG: 3'-5' exonuclease [Alloprevotella sp.]|nr:3'-5' exonuclease [Alloprevotella sp.]